MAILNNQGCLFCYIHSELDIKKDNFLFTQVDNLNNPLESFFKKIENIRMKFSNNGALNLFCIVTTIDKMDGVREEIYKYILSDIDIINESNVTIKSFIKYVRSYYLDNDVCMKVKIIDDMVYFFICSSINEIDEEFFNRTTQAWIEFVKPSLFGKQILTQKFLLKDLNGRRIINSLVDKNNLQNYLLVEGGLKVYLNQDIPFIRDELGLNDALLTSNEVRRILMNPAYGMGRYFEPYSLFLSWKKVFLYVLAISDFSLNINNVEKVYNRFLDFIGNEICFEYEAEVIVSKKNFLQAFLIHVENIRGYLMGKNECILSKDYLLFLRSYYVFIEPLKKLVYDIFSQTYYLPDFKLDKYNKLLDNLCDGDNNTKGKSLENLVHYLFKNTKEFKVMAKRIRTDREEIDLSCANVSNDAELWNLGAFILVECKNWSEKVDVKVIRELGYITFYKGNTTSVLVARNDITDKGKDEIYRLAVLGKYILVITLEDLKTITSSDMFVNLLIGKYKHLVDEIKNDNGLLGE